MPTWSHTTAAFMIFSLSLGGLMALPVVARADDPIKIGKPIIIKDPPKPQPKGNVVPADFVDVNAA